MSQMHISNLLVLPHNYNYEVLAWQYILSNGASTGTDNVFAWTPLCKSGWNNYITGGWINANTNAPFGFSFRTIPVSISRELVINISTSGRPDGISNIVQHILVVYSYRRIGVNS